MGILDVFDENVQSERKLYPNIPKRIITKEFIELFDIEIRRQIYEDIKYNYLSINDCMLLIKLCKKDNSLFNILNQKSFISKEGLELAEFFIEELPYINKDYYYVNANKEKLLSYKQKYNVSEMIDIINNFEIIENLIGFNSLTEEYIISNLKKIEMLKIHGLSEYEIKELIKYPNIFELSADNILNTFNILRQIKSLNNNSFFNLYDLISYINKNANNDMIEFFNKTVNDKCHRIEDIFKNNRNHKEFDNYLNYLISNNKIISIDVLLNFKKFGIEYFLDEKFMDKLSNEKVDEQSKLNDIISYYKKLKQCKNNDDYLKLLNEIDYIFELKEFKEEISKFYNGILKETVLNPDKIEQLESTTVRYEEYFCKEDGKKHIIKIITLNNVPFTSLTSTITPKDKKSTLTDEQARFTDEIYNHPSYWKYISDSTTAYKGTEFISMSLNSNKRFRIFGNVNDRAKHVITGYSDIKQDQIRKTWVKDAGTDMTEGTKVESETNLIYPDELVNISNFKLSDKQMVSSWNELVSKRESIMPDYVMTATEYNNSMIPLTSDIQSKEWAAYYDVPIIEINCESYYVSAEKELNEYINYLKQLPNVPTIDELKKLKLLLYYAELFSNKSIRFYNLLCDVINMDNREWNRENIDNLILIFNETFDMQKELNIDVFKLEFLDQNNNLEMALEKAKMIRNFKERIELEDKKISMMEQNNSFNL